MTSTLQEDLHAILHTLAFVSLIRVFSSLKHTRSGKIKLESLPFKFRGPCIKSDAVYIGGTLAPLPLNRNRFESDKKSIIYSSVAGIEKTTNCLEA